MNRVGSIQISFSKRLVVFGQGQIIQRLFRVNGNSFQLYSIKFPDYKLSTDGSFQQENVNLYLIIQFKTIIVRK
jgi:hypothetical protein